MSHIRVDDDMHRRVMDAVSRAISENASGKDGEGLTAKPVSAVPAADVKPLNSDKKAPVRRRKVVPLITGLSIAAAAILVAGGAVFFSSRFFVGSKTAEAAYGTVGDVDSIVGNDSKDKGTHGIKDPKAKHDFNNKVRGATEATAAKAGGDRTEEQMETTEKAAEKETEPSVYDGSTDGTDIRNLIPFKVKFEEATTLNDGQVTGTIFYGENDESMILFTSKEGTDIAKAYYPGFTGDPAVLRTEGGVEFKGIDTLVENNAKVSDKGPYEAVTWTKNGTAYMLVFNTRTDIKVFSALIDRI